MKKQMFLGASNLIFENAKSLRGRLTEAEMVLWGHLTKGNQFGVKFRRQHPIADYIADFYCHTHKLIIELDGTIHNIPEVADNDIARQKHLESLGITVIRFKNQEIFENLEQVLDIINNILVQRYDPPEHQHPL
jgi:cyclase